MNQQTDEDDQKDVDSTHGEGVLSDSCLRSGSVGCKVFAGSLGGEHILEWHAELLPIVRTTEIDLLPIELATDSVVSRRVENKLIRKSDGYPVDYPSPGDAGEEVRCLGIRGVP